MFNFFKKTKKEEMKMEESTRGFSNQEINNETISQIFRGLDSEYAALKQAIAREFSDYDDMLARERKQATIYKNKVQVRDVMEEILPVLSEMSTSTRRTDRGSTSKRPRSAMAESET